MAISKPGYICTRNERTQRDERKHNGPVEVVDELERVNREGG
jgi:hypothetical protein